MTVHSAVTKGNNRAEHKPSNVHFSASDMIRKRRTYKQLACAFILVIGIRQLITYNSAVKDSSQTTTPLSPSLLPYSVYPRDFLQELNETAQLYPKLVTTVERRGPGIDPRTIDLRNKTLYALAGVSSHSCNIHEQFLDRFITDTSQTRIPRYKYMQEMQIVRTVVEMCNPEAFTHASVREGDKITLLTQLTSDRTYMLDIIVQRWQGPIIAVVYVSQSIVSPKHKQLAHWLSTIKREDICLLLVTKAGMLYPVNWLRNLVMQRAESKYIFMIDGDFIPSVQLHRNLLKHFQTLETNQIDKTVLLVPAYEMVIADMDIPRAREDLLNGVQLGLIDGFHKGEFAAAHNVTNYRKWATATEPYILPKQTPCNDHFEPYLVMERAKSPYFPETLLERRKNKIAYQYELCSNGYQYMVIHDGFLVHKHHPISMRALAKVEYCVDVAWRTFMAYVKKHPMKVS